MYEDVSEYYRNAVAEHNSRWHAFTGRVFLVGIKLGLTVEQMTEYIFESFHALTTSEIPKTIEETKRDLILYFKEKE